MNLFEFSFLADENIHPDVIQYLREQGHDIRSVYDVGLVGHSDTAVLRVAQQSGRIVISHDSDFDTLTLAHIVAVRKQQTVRIRVRQL